MARALRRVVGLVGDVARLDHHDIEFNSLRKILGTPGGGGGGGGGGDGNGVVDATFVTVDDETGQFSNAKQLVKGLGIDLTIVGTTLVISATGAANASPLNIPPRVIGPATVTVDATPWTYYRADATAGACVFNLPRAVGSGVVWGFMKMDSSANGIVPTTTFAGDLIGDSGSYTVDTRQSVVWIADVDAGQFDVINLLPMA